MWDAALLPPLSQAARIRSTGGQDTLTGGLALRDEVLRGANFDSRFSANSHLGYRLGLAFNAGRTSDKSEGGACVYQGPAAVFEAYGLIGGTNHSLELGVGMMHGIFKRDYEWDATPPLGMSSDPPEIWKYGYYGFANVGYRYQPAVGFFLRAGVNPTFVPETHYGISRFLVYPYLGLGFAF